MPPATPERSSVPGIVWFALWGAVGAVLLWSALQPADYFTWILETFPVWAAILAATRRRFPLTPLAYALIAVHMSILCVGGHYTYAHVPLFDWLGRLFGWQRNHYDRLGHLAQGFVPALLTREILIRRSPLRPGKWLFFITLSVVLAISASYELIEWAVAASTGSAAEAFLGTQGDPWDTQKDMFMALWGALACLGLLSRPHDRQLSAFRSSP